MLEKLEQIAFSDVPDAAFPTDNIWGIPVLRESYQADFVDLPFTQWGAIGRNRRMPGTYSFYVDDYRFSALWKNPRKVVDTGCISAIEPNITLTLQKPLAYVIAAIYCKRWIARFWQENGIRMFVDMNVPPEYQKWNLMGVPAGWRAYSTHGYNGRIKAMKEEYQYACQHAGTKDILWVVYGGGKEVKAFCEKKKWIHIPEQFDQVNGKYSGEFEGTNFTFNRERLEV